LSSSAIDGCAPGLPFLSGFEIAKEDPQVWFRNGGTNETPQIFTDIAQNRLVKHHAVILQ
jgi:hypothetical protein